MISKAKKIKALTKFLVISISIVILYTVVELILSTAYGVSHDTLSTCVYAFFGTELASCTLVKIFNIVKGKGEE